MFSKPTALISGNCFFCAREKLQKKNNFFFLDIRLLIIIQIIILIISRFWISSTRVDSVVFVYAHSYVSRKCLRFVRKKRCPRAGAEALIPAPNPAPRTRTIPTAARPVLWITTTRPPLIGYRGFSAGASSKRSSTDPARKTSNATSCGSTGTGVNTAGFASASASAWVEMVSNFVLLRVLS